MNRTESVLDSIRLQREELATEMAELAGRMEEMMAEDRALERMADAAQAAAAPTDAARFDKPRRQRRAKAQTNGGSIGHAEAKDIVIAYLRDQDGPVTQAQIRHMMGVGSSRMTQIMSSMEEEGLVKRELLSTRGDKSVSLTPAALEQAMVEA